MADPSWTTAELLRAADAAQCLSAAWLLPLSSLDPATMTSSQRVLWAVATNRLVAVTEELSLRAIASVPSQPCATPNHHAFDHAQDRAGDGAAAGTGDIDGTGASDGDGADAPVSAFPDENADPDDIHAGDGPGPCPGGIRCPHTWEVEELAALMRLSRRRVINRRQLGGELAGRFTVFAPLLATGQISLGHLLLLSGQLAHCSETTAAAVAQATVERSTRQSPQPFARSVSRALSRCISPEEAAARHANAVKASSGVRFWPREDGLLGMGVTGSVEKVEALRAIFGTHPSINRPTPGETRTKGERQVDFLLDACTHATTNTTNPTRATPAAGPTTASPTAATTPAGTAGQPTASRAPDTGDAATDNNADLDPDLHADSDTAAEPDPAADSDADSDADIATATATDIDIDIGAAADADSDVDMAADSDVDMAGGGQVGRGEVAIGVVITASVETLEGLSNEPGMVGETVTDAATIRNLAADSRWGRGSLYDRRGIILNTGRAQRFPNRAQRRTVGLRNPRCVFPGCSRTAAGAHIDHTKAWQDGGRTDLANLYPLCQLHHHLKHQPGWTCHTRRDGSLLWTLPHGQQIIVEPQDYRVPPGPHDRTYTQLDHQHQQAIEDAHHEAWLTWAINNDPGTTITND